MFEFSKISNSRVFQDAIIAILMGIFSAFGFNPGVQFTFTFTITLLAAVLGALILALIGVIADVGLPGLIMG